MTKEILRIKERLDVIESKLKVKDIPQIRMCHWIPNLIFTILFWWWINLIIYAIAGIYKSFKVVFISKEKKLKMYNCHIQKDFNEYAYFWDRLFDD